MRRFGQRRAGSAIVEFTLTGIPVLFAWISVVEMARGMWNYHTLQYAVKETAGYVAVHGATCGVAPNSCLTTVGSIASVLQSRAIGIPASQLNATLTTQSGAATTCNPITTCTSSSTQWPPSASADNAVGKYFTIRVDYVFRSALSMAAPGPGPRVVKFGVFNLPGYTRQMILF